MMEARDTHFEFEITYDEILAFRSNTAPKVKQVFACGKTIHIVSWIHIKSICCMIFFNQALFHLDMAWFYPTGFAEQLRIEQQPTDQESTGQVPPHPKDLGDRMDVEAPPEDDSEENSLSPRGQGEGLGVDTSQDEGATGHALSLPRGQGLCTASMDQGATRHASSLPSSEEEQGLDTGSMDQGATRHTISLPSSEELDVGTTSQDEGATGYTSSDSTGFEEEVDNSTRTDQRQPATPVHRSPTEEANEFARDEQEEFSSPASSQLTQSDSLSPDQLAQLDREYEADPEVPGPSSAEPLVPISSEPGAEHDPPRGSEPIADPPLLTRASLPTRARSSQAYLLSFPGVHRYLRSTKKVFAAPHLLQMVEKFSRGFEDVFRVVVHELEKLDQAELRNVILAVLRQRIRHGYDRDIMYCLFILQCFEKPDFRDILMDANGKLKKEHSEIYRVTLPENCHTFYDVIKSTYGHLYYTPPGKATPVFRSYLVPGLSRSCIFWQLVQRTDWIFNKALDAMPPAQRIRCSP